MPTRTEFGHKYTWDEVLGSWHNRNEDQRGRPVHVVPPISGDTSWWAISSTIQSFFEIKGEDAEKRAFSMAAGLITQG